MHVVFDAKPAEIVAILRYLEQRSGDDVGALIPVLAEAARILVRGMEDRPQTPPARDSAPTCGPWEEGRLRADQWDRGRPLAGVSFLPCGSVWLGDDGVSWHGCIYAPAGVPDINPHVSREAAMADVDRLLAAAGYTFTNTTEPDT